MPSDTVYQSRTLHGSGRRDALRKDIGELDELIDELILMTRLDTGLSDPRFDPVDLVAVAAEDCARYRDCTLSGASGDVLGDRRMIKHMLRNLVDNAHAHGEPPVDVKIGREGDSVVLTVSDSGPGIPDSEREKVFQPFYRAVTKQNVPGHGLGLPMVQRIAEMHGGSVLVRSHPRSAVSVTFPSDGVGGGAEAPRAGASLHGAETQPS